MGTAPMPAELRMETIFASGACDDLLRLQAEYAIPEREQKLRQLVDRVMDAIIELEENLQITRINPPAAKVPQCKAPRLFGKNFTHFFARKDLEKLRILSKISTRHLQANDHFGFRVASSPSAWTARNFL